MNISLIVAMSRNGVIGRGNALPWHLPADLQHFRRLTMGKPIIMGRRTHDSIGRALPGRTNIVVSRNRSLALPGIAVAQTVPAALAIAAEAGAAEAMIIGGEAIYRETLPLAQRLYLTVIHAHVDGDAQFPDFDRGAWREIGREDCAASGANAFDYSFVVLQRSA